MEQEQARPGGRAVFGEAKGTAVCEPENLIETSEPGPLVIHFIAPQSLG
jgi:hypothetical protein